MHGDPKILVIDIGNSFTKLGCFVAGQLEFSECFPTETDDLSQYQEELVESLPSDGRLQFDGAVIASVVPAAKPLIDQLLSTVFHLSGAQVLWVDREDYPNLTFGPVDFSMYQPQSLGADRVANAVAGVSQFPGHKVLVCDFGTTTNFEMVEDTGHFIGGAICPGPLKFQSLLTSDHAAQLFEVDVFQKPQATPGLSTQVCLENGLYYGYKGAILEIVGNLLQESHWPLSLVKIIFTGGYAQQVRNMLTLEIPQVHIDSGLTMKGLYTLWELNQGVRC